MFVISIGYVYRLNYRKWFNCRPVGPALTESTILLIDLTSLRLQQVYFVVDWL